MVKRAAALLLLLPLLVAAKCGGGSGSGGRPAVLMIDSSVDPRCSTLPQSFPPGFAFLPGLSGRVLAANVSGPAALVPLDISSSPFQVPAGLALQVIPDDSDGDASPEFVNRPVIDDVFALTSDLALISMSGYEQLFFSDGGGAARTLSVEVSAAVEPWRYPRLPAPGSGPADRTALSTSSCIDPPADALDSRGASIADSIPAAIWCKPQAPSFPSAFTAGAALAAGHLFVPVSNLLDPRPRTAPLFGPGAVLVFDVAGLPGTPRVEPNALAPRLLTSAFNPTEVTAYTSPSGREFILVTNSGAIGVRDDDPATDAFEAGALALSEGAIDVIDVAALRVIATYPFDDGNPSFRRLAIDPSGRVAMAGHVARKEILGVDLAPLDSLPAIADLPADSLPIRLDGSQAGFDDAVLFDARSPLRIPARAGGAPESACPGSVESVAFNDAGSALFAVEECDGSFVTVTVDFSGDPSTSELRGRFAVERVEGIAAPLRADNLGQQRQPASLSVRPGLPGTDFTGPDVFFTLGSPDGALCGIRVDSPSR